MIIFIKVLFVRYGKRNINLLFNINVLSIVVLITKKREIIIKCFFFLYLKFIYKITVFYDLEGFLGILNFVFMCYLGL